MQQPQNGSTLNALPIVETTVFDVEKNRQALLLHLADTTLILAQRQAEWCGHGPILEQDIAISNISLDLLGQSRNFYQHAATLIGNNTDEDKLAYLRTEREFKNLLLVEQPNGDWGQTVLRLFFFSQYQYLLFEQLQLNADEQLAAICTKALKEIKYHVRWSSEWVIRLGDGTQESKQRMLHAVDFLWRYTGEMFVAADYEKELNISWEELKLNWLQKISSVFNEATLQIPENTFMQTGGKNGVHTEALGFILTELQYLQRTYPNSQW
jgi:ring-1,2-phenylacetyl-CoA epoxidase subunit PaaC